MRVVVWPAGIVPSMQPYDPIDLSAQERRRAQQEGREAFLRERDKDDFQWLMGDERGRRVVFGMLEATGVFRSSFTGNSETFFREGMRNVGLILMGKIHAAAPEKYTQMLQEQKNGSGNDADH